jgi:hypothetical protein
MEILARRVRGKSFLCPCLLVGLGSVLLIALAPATYDAGWAAIGFSLFGPLFAIQAASGVALDNWWVARIERKTQPYSYWWPVVFCGVGAAGFAYRILVPAAA